MTVDEIKKTCIPLPSYTEADVLYFESALCWLQENTTLEFDKDDVASVKHLPAGAKMFVVKYREAMSLPLGVTSESVDGLSQSFSDSLKDALWDYAEQLLGDVLKSSLKFTAAKARWA